MYILYGNQMQAKERDGGNSEVCMYRRRLMYYILGVVYISDNGQRGNPNLTTSYSTLRLKRHVRGMYVHTVTM